VSRRDKGRLWGSWPHNRPRWSISVVLQQQSTTVAGRPGAAGDSLPSMMQFAPRLATNAGGRQPARAQRAAGCTTARALRHGSPRRARPPTRAGRGRVRGRRGSAQIACGSQHLPASGRGAGEIDVDSRRQCSPPLAAPIEVLRKARDVCSKTRATAEPPAPRPPTAPVPSMMQLAPRTSASDRGRPPTAPRRHARRRRRGPCAPPRPSSLSRAAGRSPSSGPGR
jgi:hypothetical protein